MPHIVCILMTTMRFLAVILFHHYPRRRATTPLTHQIFIPDIQNLLNPRDNHLFPCAIPYEPLGQLPIILHADFSHRDESIPATHRKWKHILNIFIKTLAASLPAIQMALATILQANSILHIVILDLLQVGVSLTQTDTDIPQTLSNLRYLPNPIPFTRPDPVRCMTHPSILNPISMLRSLFGMPLRVEIYDIEGAQHSLILWDPHYCSARSVLDGGVHML